MGNRVRRSYRNLNVANMLRSPPNTISGGADVENPYEEYGIYDFNKLLKQLRFKITDRINYLLNLLVHPQQTTENRKKEFKSIRKLIIEYKNIK